MEKRVKVTVTGAAGQIGYALLFRIAAGEMFGPETRVDLSLLELEGALPRLKGVLMELEDCAFPLLKSVTATSDSRAAFKDADWALLVGSVPRKEGMERADLLKINGKVFVEQGRALDSSARSTCRVLVVGNPCNTNALIAKSVATRIPGKNFFAMTYLDQSRAVAQLAQKACVPTERIQRMIVWGNHSSTQFPDFYHAEINGKPATEVIKDDTWFKTEFMQSVQKRGSAVIKARGQSSAASAAHAVIQTVKNLDSPSTSTEPFSCGVLSDGSYGVERGLIFSFPIRRKGNGWDIVQKIEHGDDAQQRIYATHKELLAEREAVKDLLPS